MFSAIKKIKHLSPDQFMIDVVEIFYLNQENTNTQFPIIIHLCYIDKQMGFRNICKITGSTCNEKKGAMYESLKVFQSMNNKITL